MALAIRNLLLVTFAMVFGLAVTWLYVRNSALADPVKRPMSHPFLDRPFPAKVAYAPVLPAVFPLRSADLAGFAKLPPNVIVWLPVDLAPDGSLEVRDISGSEVPLEQALRRYPAQRLILNFLEDRPGTVEKILTALDAAEVAGRILIQSPVEGLLRDLRERRPRWLFGTSAAQTTRLRMLTSIGLQAAAPLKGDCLVIEQLPKRLAEIAPEVVAEAHRRHLRVIAGPVDTREEAEELFARAVDAVMITDQSDLKKAK